MCRQYFHGDCPVHGPPFHLKDKPIFPDSNISAARATLPDVLYLDISSIPNAGTGVFAKEKIEERTQFGPYVGELRIDDAFETSYNWEVRITGCACLFHCRHAVTRFRAKSNIDRLYFDIKIYATCSNVNFQS